MGVLGTNIDRQMFNTAKRLGKEGSESEPVADGFSCLKCWVGGIYNSETEPSLQPMAYGSGKNGEQDYNLSFQIIIYPFRPLVL